MNRACHFAAAGAALFALALVRDSRAPTAHESRPIETGRVAPRASMSVRAASTRTDDRSRASRPPDQTLPAARLLAEISPDSVDARLQSIVSRWAASDPEAALRWLALLPDGRAKRHLIATVGLVLAPADLPGAIQLAELLPRGGDRRWLVAGIVRVWSQRDPAGAAAWISPLPEGLERNQATREIAAAWACSNPVAAKQWLQTLPPGESRSEGFAAFSANQLE